MAQSGWVSVLFIFFFIIGDKRGIEPRHVENYQNHIAQTCFAVSHALHHCWTWVVKFITNFQTIPTADVSQLARVVGYKNYKYTS